MINPVNGKIELPEDIDYSDKDNLIKIIAFERRQHDILIGYRQNNRVVYASVSTNSDDTIAKQHGYEQVRSALEYEQTLTTPSIDGSDMEPIEVFTPAASVVTTVSINGPSIVTFDDEGADKTVTYTAVAYNQYGEAISSQTIEQTFDNADGNEVVSVTIDGVRAALIVRVQAYKLPEPSDTEELFNYILDVDMRLIMVEMELL